MKTMRAAALLLMTTALSLGGLDAVAKERKSKPEAEGEGPARHGVLVYSDLCTEKGSGNIAGRRIVLFRYADGDMLTYEYSQGALGWPQFAERVSVDNKTREIRFVARRDARDPSGTVVNAKFSRDGSGLYVFGDVNGEWAKPVRIPLVKDFARKWPSCGAE